MKKITILALGGAGENFLNSIERDFKKDISDIEFNLFHLEEKSFSKPKLEKSINKSSGIFVVFGDRKINCVNPPSIPKSLSIF